MEAPSTQPNPATQFNFGEIIEIKKIFADKIIKIWTYRLSSLRPVFTSASKYSPVHCKSLGPFFHFIPTLPLPPALPHEHHWFASWSFPRLTDLRVIYISHSHDVYCSSSLLRPTHLPSRCITQQKEPHLTCCYC